MNETVLDLMGRRAATQPDDIGYRFVPGDDGEVLAITYGELEIHARALAARLQAALRPGDRVLLLFPPGLDFVRAFFGCVYAGVIAVPCSPPSAANLGRSHPRLWSVAADCGARAILSSTQLGDLELEVRQAARLPVDLVWMDIDRMDWKDAQHWEHPATVGTEVVVLQYTSGSTSSPKGVVVTHANIMANSAMIHAAFGHSSDSYFVNWAPLYHDMGLMGSGVIQPLYEGVPVDLISPVAFTRRPALWLETISRLADRSVTSGGPNFAYEMCLSETCHASARGLDLRGWRVAFNGAEPVRFEVMEEFSRLYAGAGFSPRAFLPCYGLAEATVLVSGGPAHSGARGFQVDRAELASGRIEQNAEHGQILTSSGRLLRDQTVKIVSPQTREALPPGHVGEIWVSGDHVGQAYWGLDKESERTFLAQLATPDGRRYLRTGDLGGLVDDDLVITGRLKDVIIINGVNMYPQDVEFAAERSHAALRPGGCVAFADEDGRGVTVVAEVQPRYAALLSAGASPGLRDEIHLSLRRAVAAGPGAPVSHIALVAPRSVPKTTSGKPQRQFCRQLLAEGKIGALQELEPSD